jgi:ATP-dependent Zn protease
MSQHSTAIHEAGHAVIGRVVGLRCGGATIVPDHEEGWAGNAITLDPHISIAEWEARGRWRYDSIIRARIIVMMAAREAEIECLGQHCGGDGQDQSEIACHIDEAKPSTVKSEADRDRFEERLRRQARRLVRRHRKVIELVAKALLKHRTLSARQIDTLVQPHISLPTRVNLQKVTAERQYAASLAWATKRTVAFKSKAGTVISCQPYKPKRVKKE